MNVPDLNKNDAITTRTLWNNVTTITILQRTIACCFSTFLYTKVMVPEVIIRKSSHDHIPTIYDENQYEL